MSIFLEVAFLATLVLAALAFTVVFAGASFFFRSNFLCFGRRGLHLLFGCRFLWSLHFWLGFDRLHFGLRFHRKLNFLDFRLSFDSSFFGQ